MVVINHHIDKDGASAGKYIGHVLYQEECRSSATFPIRERAAKAPLTRPSSGVITVNFKYQKGHWTYLSGL